MSDSHQQPHPTVSMLMSVHNEASWIAQAVESILHQTYSDFELFATDDGSSDDTLHVLSSYGARDNRIRVIHHPTSRGLAASLNEQIRLARGRYIARMDGDDIARSDRLTKQVAFLETHPRVGLLGSFCREIDAAGHPVSLWRRPTANADLQRALLRYNPFIHTSVMLRRDVFAVAGLYDQTWRYAQDYELWLRVARHYQLANLPEPLVDLRVDWHKLVRKNKEARWCELRILARHIGAESYPWWYYAYLFRPLLLAVLPTRWMMKLKAMQRRGRQTRYTRMVNGQS